MLARGAGVRKRGDEDEAVGVPGSHGHEVAPGRQSRASPGARQSGRRSGRRRRTKSSTSHAEGGAGVGHAAKNGFEEPVRSRALVDLPAGHDADRRPCGTALSLRCTTRARSCGRAPRKSRVRITLTWLCPPGFTQSGPAASHSGRLALASDPDGDRLPLLRGARRCGSRPRGGSMRSPMRDDRRLSWGASLPLQGGSAQDLGPSRSRAADGRGQAADAGAQRGRPPRVRARHAAAADARQPALGGLRHQPPGGKRTAPSARNWQEIDVYVVSARARTCTTPRRTR